MSVPTEIFISRTSRAYHRNRDQGSSPMLRFKCYHSILESARWGPRERGNTHEHFVKWIILCRPRQQLEQYNVMVQDSPQLCQCEVRKRAASQGASNQIALANLPCCEISPHPGSIGLEIVKLP